MNLCPSPASPTTGAMPPLKVINMADFLSMTLPERDFLLHPVIPSQGIVIMFAPRGIGKTFAALSAALAVAGGLSVYNWRATKGHRVHAA